MTPEQDALRELDEETAALAEKNPAVFERLLEKHRDALRPPQSWYDDADPGDESDAHAATRATVTINDWYCDACGRRMERKEDCRTN